MPPPPPSNSSLGPYSTFDPSVSIIILVLVSGFVFITLFSIYVHHCSDTMITVPTPARGHSVKHGLDPAVIRTFPTFIYSAVKDLKLGKGSLECAVCLSEFEDDETLRLIPKCDHVFHPDCIDLWLASHATCPVCRANLAAEHKEEARSSNSNNELNSNQNQNQNQNSNENNSVSEIVIDVNDGLRRSNQMQLGEIGRRNDVVSLRFPRSHSTGHSLVQAGVNVERYTLRLPDEIRKQIIISNGLGREGSSGKGSCRSGGDGSSRGKRYADRLGGWSDRWIFSRSPPFVSMTGSVNYLKFEREGSSNSSGKNLLPPLNCLNVKVDPGEESSSTPSKRRV